jgi:diacylglycerol kinase family enzyme
MNPKANNLRGEQDAREWAKCLNEEVTYVNVLETKDMKGFVLGLNPEDEIIVAGGDGTLNHFANDVADIDVQNNVYYVKSGSGNDFYRDNKEYCNELGMIPLNKFIKNLPIIHVNGITRRFINGIGYGLDGETCRVGEEIRSSDSTKKIDYTSIAIKLLLGGYKLKHATVTVDGETCEYDHVWLASTMKGRYYGGGLMVAPNQNRFDEEHRVSVVALYKKSRLGTLMRFPSLNKGEHIKKTDWVTTKVGKKVEVKFDKPCALQIDGEVVLNVTSYTVEVPEK